MCWLINSPHPPPPILSKDLAQKGETASEGSFWLHPWPLSHRGQGGLFFPGWLCLSTWPHKDRQRWLSYINTCRGIAPLTLHEIFLWAECAALLEINCFPIKHWRPGVNLHRVLSPSTARDAYCQVLLSSGICNSFPEALNSSPLRGVKFSSTWQDWKSWNIWAKFSRLDQILQRHHTSIWNDVSSFLSCLCDWFPLFIPCIPEQATVIDFTAASYAVVGRKSNTGHQVKHFRTIITSGKQCSPSCENLFSTLKLKTLRQTNKVCYHFSKCQSSSSCCWETALYTMKSHQ